MTKHLSAALLVAFVAAVPANAMASTMPKADFGSHPTLGVGAGNGVGVSLDFPVSSALSLGLGANLARFQAANLDLRLLYKLTRAGGLDIDLLAGAGAAGFGGNVSFEPFIGVALAYPFTTRFVGRLNIAAAVQHLGAPDASGIELGYKFTNALEGTIGANGRGDFIGLKLTL